jgi:hypothetical protein
MSTAACLDLRASPSPLPRIGADNLLRRGTITASGGIGAHACDYRLDRAWQPGAGTQTLTVVLASAAPCDYFFLALHNLGTDDAAGSVSVQRWTGSAWLTVLAALSPADGGAIWRSFDGGSSAQWRITLVTAAGKVPSIACLSIGQALVLEEGILPGWSPPALATGGETIDSLSEDGYLIGRTLRQRPAETVLALPPVSDAWVRAHWQPVRQRLIRQPWALAWSPHAADGGTALAWAASMPPPDVYDRYGFIRIAWPIRMIERRDTSVIDQVVEA